MSEVGWRRRVLTLAWTIPIILGGATLAVAFVALPFLYPLTLAASSWFWLLARGRWQDLSRLCLVVGATLTFLGGVGVVVSSWYWLAGEQSFGQMFIGYGLVVLSIGVGSLLPILELRPSKSDLVEAFKWSGRPCCGPRIPRRGRRVEALATVGALAIGALGLLLLSDDGPQILVCGPDLNGFEFGRETIRGFDQPAGVERLTLVEGGYVYRFEVGAPQGDVDRLVAQAQTHPAVTQVIVDPTGSDRCS